MIMLVSCTVVGLAVVATRMHGLAAGVGVFAVLVLQIELLVLSRHLWPEGLLVAIHAGIAVVLIAGGDATLHAFLLGGMSALAFLVRFEQIILVPVIAVAGFFSGTLVAATDFLLLALPPALSWWFLSVRNARRYGIALPDTTWHFNLQIAREEAARYSANQPIRITRIVSNVVQDSPPRLTAENWRSIQLWQWPAGLVNMPQRAWALAGPDSFIRQRLFAHGGGAYAVLLPRWADLWLQWAFPLLFSLSFVHALQIGELPVWLWPALAFMVATAAVFTRTRYRLPVIPVLVFWVVPSMQQWLQGATPAAILLWLTAGVFLACLLVRFPSRQEL